MAILYQGIFIYPHSCLSNPKMVDLLWITNLSFVSEEISPIDKAPSTSMLTIYYTIIKPQI